MEPSPATHGSSGLPSEEAWNLAVKLWSDPSLSSYPRDIKIELAVGRLIDTLLSQQPTLWEDTLPQAWKV